MRLGYSVTYHSEWFPIGHSLGQIAYSLPLAPGEKMKIAVVDWTRHDAAKRTEQTTEKEDLQHAALRDRTLTEAVQMVVRESQSGSSFMAGGSLSAGAGIPIGPVSLGVGAASGLGGASTDSEGMRSLVGETTQKISDAFHQASSAQRELNSTVVVQAEQAEKAEARTRSRGQLQPQPRADHSLLRGAATPPRADETGGRPPGAVPQARGDPVR